MIKPLNLIILGPQGSGKGTQAALLAEKFNLVVIGAGEALREIAKTDTELGRKVHQTINVEGRLVEEDLISQVMKEKISSVPSDQGLILDSYPRSLEQYKLFKKFWPALGREDYQVVFIELSEREAIKRLSTRVTCESCGEIYIEGMVEACQKCGGRLYKREDDKPEAVKMRLELFNSQTLPLIAEMEKEGRVVRIDGAPSVEEVYKEILKKLGL